MKTKEFNELWFDMDNELLFYEKDLVTLIPKLRIFINYMRYFNVISEKQYLKLMELIYTHIDLNKLWLELG